MPTMRQFTFMCARPMAIQRLTMQTMAEIVGCANRKLLAKAIGWALKNKPLIQSEWDKLNGE
jgi:hypothetical protein